jgi:hypothetical protein
MFLFTLDLSGALSAAWLLIWTVLTAASLAGTRLLVCAALRKFPDAGHDIRGIAVVGSGVHCQRVICNVDASSRVAGVVDRYRIKLGITGWAQVNGYRGGQPA